MLILDEWNMKSLVTTRQSLFTKAYPNFKESQVLTSQVLAM